jgi:glycosyltransferase involved in cell wall biosynthesis
MTRKKISIAGTVGVPASYGGFETLAENLVAYAESSHRDVDLAVYCSGPVVVGQVYRGASLRYIDRNANGISSILYDFISLFSAIRHKDDVVLLLGVSGAIALPFVRLVSKVKVVTNIDGIEWKRDKWGRLASAFLRFSEYLAVKFSHRVLADNEGIAEHVRQIYGQECDVIAYGGDHAVQLEGKPVEIDLPENYMLGLCRIEPENNVALILEAFSGAPDNNLVFIGNWASSEFGKSLKVQYQAFPNITLVDPIYDVGILKTVRAKAMAYVHGHSAGGTNPSLVEMMHFGIPVMAFDCVFNRHTTEDKAFYFGSAEQLCQELSSVDSANGNLVGENMLEIAQRRYTWEIIAKQYFDILQG